MYEDSPVKALPPSRRRMTPPTPLQNSYSSFVWEQGRYEVENQIWRAREKAPWRQSSCSSSIERQWQAEMEEQRSEWSPSVRKVIGAVRLFEPEDEGVCLRYILKCSTRGSSTIFKLFDTSERKEHLVANGRRWLSSQQEGQPRKRGGQRGGQMSGMMLSDKGQWQKPRRLLKGP